MSGMMQTVKIEFSINSNTTRSQMQISDYVSRHLRDMLYDSKTQPIQFTDWRSGLKSPSNNLQTRCKKLKRCRRVNLASVSVLTNEYS